MCFPDESIAKFDAFYYLVEQLAHSQHGLTVKELSDRLGKSTKTVRRYLDSIDGSICQIELIKERGPDRKYRYKVDKFATPFRPLVFNAYQILALYFIRGFAHFKELDLIQKNLSEVFASIELSANEAKKRSGNNFQERVSRLFILPKELGGKGYNEKSDIECLGKLIESALDHRVCEISYGTDGSNKTFKIAPLHFFNYRDAIYLLSKNIQLSKVYSKNIYTNLAMHRINSVDHLDEKFEYPKDLDLKKYFKSGSFNFADTTYEIVLTFPPKLKEYILERDWYPNQEIELEKNGSVTLKFESDLNMILTGWIRGFGSDVKVLGPKILKKQIISDLKKNLKHYTS